MNRSQKSINFLREYCQLCLKYDMEIVDHEFYGLGVEDVADIGRIGRLIEEIYDEIHLDVTN